MQDDRHRGNLGSKFENFGAAPSEGLWDSIADSLDGKKKRRAAIWWWIGPGIAAVGLICIILLNGNDPLFQPTHKTATSIDVQSKNERTFFDRHTVSRECWSYEQRMRDKKAAMESLSRSETFISETDYSNKSANEAVSINDNLAEATEDILVEMDFVADEIAETPALSGPLNLDKLPILTLKPIELAFNSEPIGEGTLIKNQRKSKWELGVGLNNWSTLKMKNPQKDDAALALSDPGPEPDSGDLALEGVTELSYYAPSTSISVKKPVGLVFHVGYRFNERFRLVSGLNAEYALYQPQQSSSWGSALNDQAFYYSQTTIKVLTLGIPLGVEFDFIKRRRFRMGAGFSVLNELPVLLRYKADNTINSLEAKSNENRFLKGYNLGLNLNLNTSYYVTDQWRIQMNPGVRWYMRQRMNSDLNLPTRKLWLGGSIKAIYCF